MTTENPEEKAKICFSRNETPENTSFVSDTSKTSEVKEEIEFTSGRVSPICMYPFVN